MKCKLIFFLMKCRDVVVVAVVVVDVKAVTAVIVDVDDDAVVVFNLILSLSTLFI